jgi:hypothetical protein
MQKMSSKNNLLEIVFGTQGNNHNITATNKSTQVQQKICLMHWSMNRHTHLHSSFAKDQNSVIVHDGIDTMRNGEHGRGFELGAYGILNQFVSFMVNLNTTYLRLSNCYTHTTHRVRIWDDTNRTIKKK